ncbi:MAG: hypothetical protein EON86_15745 [Brevundimonas sp.]|nr:MAG: hypothetical protein EON86_15745 [Brevundimonas sp.]
MTRRIGFRLLPMLVLLIGGPAVAQDRSVCFEPQTVFLTSDGYRTVLEAVAAFGSTTPRNERGSPSSLAVMVPQSATALDRARADEALLELLMAGAPPLQVRVNAEGDRGEGDCLPIRVVPDCCVIRETSTLFFDSGSDVAPRDWRRSGRFLLVDYRPGESLFLVDGYTDTAEADVDLSRRRAENAARELVRLGVRWDDIRIEAHGDARLVLPTPAATPEPLNRRVDIQVRSRPPERLD